MNTDLERAIKIINDLLKEGSGPETFRARNNAGRFLTELKQRQAAYEEMCTLSF